MWEKTLNSFNKGYHWLKQDGYGPSKDQNGVPESRVDGADEAHGGPQPARRRAQTNVVPMLPRSFTFKRQNSEMRDRLTPHEPSSVERRARSVDRRAFPDHIRDTSPPPLPPYASAPNITPAQKLSNLHFASDDLEGIGAGVNETDDQFSDDGRSISLGPKHDEVRSDVLSLDEPAFDDDDLESRWILNLSMHFRDRSDREKFFVTYAKEPNKWVRVTVSLDYRELASLPDDALEVSLKALHYQRDKSAKIYDCIKDSLDDIQWYDTVTNLKLQTQNGRLHVHVTEDVHENIQYPPASIIRHLECPQIRESDVEFDSHISGFVYRVRINSYPSHNDASLAPKDNIFIKKEIPGPDAVEEFLYEINALASLRDSNHIVHFDGIIVSDNEPDLSVSVDSPGPRIKGLLLRYASNGALIDMLYDNRILASPNHVYQPSNLTTELTNMDGTLLPIDLRLRWAHQILVGLRDIHAAGFVQGDFTLSNIVIDSENNARIIDINRRGCPVGWEPPELATIIKSGGRVAMFIGVKSDLFQAGMVLWGLGEGWDEPERVERPLTERWGCKGGDAPDWYQELAGICLSDRPQDRLSAEELVQRFEQNWTPPQGPDPGAGSDAVLLGPGSKSLSVDECEWPSEARKDSAGKGRARSPSPRRPEKEYIDPAMAVSLDEIHAFKEEKARERGIPYERIPSEPELGVCGCADVRLELQDNDFCVAGPSDLLSVSGPAARGLGVELKPMLDLECIQDLTGVLNQPDEVPTVYDDDVLSPNSAPPPALTTGTGTEAETPPERSPEMQHVEYLPDGSENPATNVDDAILTPRREPRGERKENGNDADRERDHSERWETIYVDGNQRLVSRGSGTMAVKESQHDKALGLAGSPRNRSVAIEEQDEPSSSLSFPLLTETEHSHQSSRPASLSSSPGRVRPVLPERRATFQERMAELSLQDAKGWEDQMMRREDVGGMSLFGPPVHQDSGFVEGDGQPVGLVG